MMNEEATIQWIEDIDIVTALISFTYRSVFKYFARELGQYHIGWGHFDILMSLYDQEVCSQASLAQSKGFNKTMIAKSILRQKKKVLFTVKSIRKTNESKGYILQKLAEN
jgi:hypothetical protein